MNKDRFGFQFWLGWIFWFCFSFVLSAAVFTQCFKFLFGEIRGTELTIAWSASVFGTWFLLVIPFMRKKEQIWKRLNRDQERSVDAWLASMGSFIGLFIASSLAWSYFYRQRIPEPGFDLKWAKAVFGTWLALTVPFLILMYRRADEIFKTAVSRQTGKPVHSGIFIEKSKRLLPAEMAEKIAKTRPVLANGHLITAVLKDGSRVPNLFVVNEREILGVYDRSALGFQPQDVVDVEVMEPEHLPAYVESRWLRLDG